LLNNLLHDSSIAVVREAIVTVGEIRYSEAVPLLIDKLADNGLRREARQALIKFGDAVIPDLVQRLSDDTEDPVIRRRIPKALALSGKRSAAVALIERLHRLNFHLDYSVLKALNRLRTTSPDIIINEELVRAAINKERDEYDRLRTLQSWLQVNQLNQPVFSLLMRAINERLQHRVERIFRLVGLIYSPHDIYSVYYNCNIKPALRSAAIEFLDNLLDMELKKTVTPLLEETLDPENAFRGRAPVHFSSLSAALSTLINGDDPWLKAIAEELRRQIGEQSDEPRKRRFITN
jgi:ATP:ADP antiporter, AAA family